MKGPLLAAVLLALVTVPGSLAQSSCRISVVGSGTAPVGTTLSAAAITAATVACTGQTAAFTGPSALQRFAANFTGGFLLAQSTCRPGRVDTMFGTAIFAATRVIKCSCNLPVRNARSKSPREIGVLEGSSQPGARKLYRTLLAECEQHNCCRSG